MLNILIPDAAFDSIGSITPDFFLDRGIKAVFLDIDNTLVLPRTKVPDEAAERFISSLSASGITVCLVSNNKKKRVNRFNTLSLIAVHRAAKPLAFSYLRLLKKLGIKKSEAAAVGDQLFSDISGAKAAGILAVYVKPIKPGGEGAFVHLKRRLEKPIIKKLGI